MTRYLLISRSAEYESRVTRLLGDQVAAVPGEYLTFGADTVMSRVTEPPAIVLLGPLLSFEETRRLVDSFTERYGGLGLIIVREHRPDLEEWIEHMPVHAVLSPDASETATGSLIERLDDWLVQNGRVAARDGQPVAAVEERVRLLVDLGAAQLDAVGEGDDRAPAPATHDGTVRIEDDLEPIDLPPALPDGVRSEIIAVVAPKGGQGKTTSAINLAAGLARSAPNSVVLVDADLQFGDIANALELNVAHALDDIVVAAANGDELGVKTSLAHHPDGFFVAAAPSSPEAADAVSSAALGGLVRELASMFRYVVVDTTPGLGEHVLSVLESSTDGVFVTNMSVPSLRALRTELSLLATVDLIPPRRHVVLNFADRLSGITPRDAAAILGASVDVVVPRSPAVLLASNRGRPLITDDPKDAAARAMLDLVSRVDASATPARRLFRRKGKTA